MAITNNAKMIKRRFNKMCKWCDENKIDNDFISYEDEYASNKSF